MSPSPASSRSHLSPRFRLSRVAPLRTFALLTAIASLLPTNLIAQSKPRPSRPRVPAGDLRGALPSANLERTSVTATLPNGRRITPAGEWLQVAPFPFTLAVRPDDGELVMPSIGWPFSLNIVQQPGAAASVVRTPVRRLPPGRKNDPDVQVMTGVVYSPDGKLLYDSTGDTGAVDLYSTESWRRVARVPLDGMTAGKRVTQSFAAAIALSPDGRLLYVLDQANWRVVVIDTATRERVASLPTGANPFAVALSPDGKRLYVTNSGLFEYLPVAGVDPSYPLETGLTFPPFGYPSQAAREGAFAEGHTVPGLGPENSTRGSSLWSYDVSAATEPRLLAKLRLGAAIGGDSPSAARMAIGGAAPTGVVASAERVYVALAHEDSIAVVTPDGTHLLAQIALSPFLGPTFLDRRGRPLRGVMPAGLALHGNRLFVTEAGINAVAVVDAQANRVLGHLPVGWYPSAAAVSNDGQRLYVVNTKGRGSGPNGGAGFHPVDRGESYIGALEFGSLSIVPLNDEAHLAAATAQVVANNLAALTPGVSLPRLHHVFLIIRENRTFDEILGDLPGADGDPSLARWGMHGWLANDPSAKTFSITPNAHALASRFGTSDRFFTDSDVSADGHRWAVAAAETPWFHVAWTSNYGGRRTGDPASASPGRRAMGGGSDGPAPEDEPEFGTLWEHVADAGLSLRNYGEGLEIEGSKEIDGSAPTGQRLLLNAPVPQPVFTSTDRQFPTFNMGIPDQVRFAEFARDFTALLARGEAPALIVIRLPADHTAEPRPQDGYPDRASFVADNDLALGKIVDLVSHSAVWNDNAMFVIEDDPQGGVDHVDAHRSIMLAVSPYLRRGALSHRHSSMGSLQKTAYELLGLGPLNLEDALAADLSDLFQATPDPEPYTAIAPDPRVFDPEKARTARPKNAREARALLLSDDSTEIAAEFRRAAKRSHPAHSKGQ